MQLDNTIINQWQQHAAGAHLFEMEKRFLSKTLKGSSGHYFVHWANEDCYGLEELVDFEHIYLSPKNDFAPLASGLQVETTALPLLSDSVDIVLLPHILEFIDQPIKLLKETQRILKAGGYVIIINFNPVSFWGLEKPFKHKQYPWNGRMLSALHLRYRLSRLGLSVTQYKTDYFRPLLSNALTLEKWKTLETIGQMCWPFLGSVYMMVVQKKKEVLMSIKTPKALRKKSIFRAGNLPEPSTKVHNHGIE